MSRKVFRKMALTNIRGNRKFYRPFFFMVLMMTAMFYNMCSISRNPVIAKDGAVEYLLKFGVYVIGLFAAIFIFYTNSFLIKRRKKELGLYYVLGMEKKHIASVLAWETCFLAFFGIGGGVVFGLLLGRLMFLIILKIFRFPVTIPYHICSPAIGSTLILFAAIFLLVFLSNVCSVRKASAMELLKSRNVGEREPRIRWLLVILGLFGIGSGYYIANTVNNVQSAISLLFVAVLLVMAGTYCLFMAVSIAILKILKKNKSYYYKTNHFVAVSGMIYRMKQNAVGLANICVLSTGVLLVISTTLSMYAGMDGIVKNRFPREIHIEGKDSSPEQNEEILKEIQETAGELGVKVENESEYACLNVTAVLKQNELSSDSDGVISMDDIASVTLIDADTYENLTGEHLDLRENEVALYHEQGALKGGFRMLDREYLAAEKLKSYPVANKMQNVVSNWINMVVSSREVLEQIAGRPDAIERNIYFDVNGTEEQIKEYYKKLIDNLSENNVITNYRSECREDFRESSFQLYGSMLFLGTYLGMLFLMVTVLIIYYKQISEGYEDRERYAIMKKVGMDKREVRRSISSQLLILFFLPLGTALIHCTAAFHLMQSILKGFYMSNAGMFAAVTAAVAGVFTVVYICVYAVTARSYYHIVNE